MRSRRASAGRAWRRRRGTPGRPFSGRSRPTGESGSFDQPDRPRDLVAGRSAARAGRSPSTTRSAAPARGLGRQSFAATGRPRRRPGGHAPTFGVERCRLRRPRTAVPWQPAPSRPQPVREAWYNGLSSSRRAQTGAELRTALRHGRASAGSPWLTRQSFGSMTGATSKAFPCPTPRNAYRSRLTRPLSLRRHPHLVRSPACRHVGRVARTDQ